VTLKRREIVATGENETLRHVYLVETDSWLISTPVTCSTCSWSFVKTCFMVYEA